MLRSIKYSFPVNLLLFSIVLISTSCVLNAQQNELSVFIRFKVKTPQSEKLQVITTGYRHEGAPWYFPQIKTEIKSGTWSEWIDLSEWNWHGKISRAGGIAEYPSIRLIVKNLASKKKIEGCEFEVQMADAPSERSVVKSFAEKSGGEQIVFLAPFPLRKNAKDFETARQMASRHASWAKKATNNTPIKLKNFEMITGVYSSYDPIVLAQDISSLKSLGFNVITGVDYKTATKHNVKINGKSWIYHPDPEVATKAWNKLLDGRIKKELAVPEGDKKYRLMTYYELSDEIRGVNLKAAEKGKLDNWFRNYLKSKRLGRELFGKDLPEIEYPINDVYKDALPNLGSIRERRLLYHASKFGHWWSTKQLRHTSNLIKSTFPNMQTGTLLPSHGFLGNAWGPMHIGMSYRMLDTFELTEQDAVDQISSEDWLGLNHMYGPRYTWTGGQTFGYLNALNRSAIGDKPILMRGFITVSDDKYLRLKAHSGIGQGMRSIYFWTYGPTYMGTENYWSDLESEYIGIAKLNRSLEKVEEVLHPAKTVSDPVAVLYSVSHDIWNNQRQAVFTERRLLWHGLRHLHIQPDFLREEDVERGKLKKYKVLYVTDWNITRKASAAIDKWIKEGGIVYLSAGAATRDEYNSPYTPEFSRFVWGGNPGRELIHQNSTYNERTVLPTIKPLTNASIRLNNRKFELPVIGVRANLNNLFDNFATFADGKPAGKIVPYGLGKIIAVGFMPMLAYGKLANFQPSTLKEEWKSEPREIIYQPLKFAGIVPTAQANVPVVEVNYLKGPKGDALVLANYTYKPIEMLTITIRTNREITKAISAEGSSIEILEQSNGVVRLKMPLEWTDIVTLE